MVLVRLPVILLAVALTACSAESQPPRDATPPDLQRDTWRADQKAPPPDLRLPDRARPIELLSNAPDQCKATLLIPDPGEEGHLCAGRLTPAAYPFEVTTVRYRLGHGTNQGVECNAGLEHTAELYVSTDAKPPATPVALATLPAAAMDPTKISTEGRTVSVDLGQPLTLSAGQHLFVAIRFAGTHPKVLCVGVNAEAPYQPDRNYWSNAAAPPYPWVQLDSFGLKGSIMVSALGYAK